MALRNPPLWILGQSHTAENDRLAGTQGLVGTAGVSAGTNDLLVTQASTPAMTVNVGSGWGWVLGTVSSTQGMYTVYNDATLTGITVSAANATLPRIDRVVLSVLDSNYSGSTSSASVYVVAGTASASPVAPAIPASSISLATLAIASGATAVTNANITDTRVRAQSALPLTSTAASTLSGLARSAVNAAVINAQSGTTYTFQLADQFQLVTASNASAQTYTIPPQSSVAWPANTVIPVTNFGAGVVSFAGGSGVTVTNTAQTLSQYQSANLIRTGSDAWTVVPFAVTGKVTVSSTTGSPSTASYTYNGVSYTSYTFTASGSIVFASPGQVDVIVQAGGGAGGSSGGSPTFSGGGGGGGGFILASSVSILSGTSYTVTIGAGGVGGTGNGGNGGNSVFGSLTAIGGGGGAGNGGTVGLAGGCGGGGNSYSTYAGGSGTTDQGFAGGTAAGSNGLGGGGGGICTAGGTGTAGAGITMKFSNAYRAFGYGGMTTTAGAANTGNGGGGGSNAAAANGANGGSGIVIVRFAS